MIASSRRASTRPIRKWRKKIQKCFSKFWRKNFSLLRRRGHVRSVRYDFRFFTWNLIFVIFSLIFEKLTKKSGQKRWARRRWWSHFIGTHWSNAQIGSSLAKNSKYADSGRSRSLPYSLCKIIKTRLSLKSTASAKWPMLWLPTRFWWDWYKFKGTLFCRKSYFRFDFYILFWLYIVFLYVKIWVKSVDSSLCLDEFWATLP